MIKAQLKPMVSMGNWEWPTPDALYKQLDEEFHFNLDPCPLDSSIDGRSPMFCSWAGKRVFCNPPYGPEIPKFLERGEEAEIAVFLLPARTDTKWFHEIALPRAAEIRFIRRRVRFGGAKYDAPFPSILVIFEKARRGQMELL